MDYTATNLDPEHHVAYWREDVGVNQHHWHWHTVYPHSGDHRVVNKSRRGELFYYMHEQMIARYGRPFLRVETRIEAREHHPANEAAHD